MSYSHHPGLLLSPYRTLCHPPQPPLSLPLWGNSIIASPAVPPRHWWDTIISQSSRPEACTVGCYDGSNHNLAGNLCLITGSGLYILLIINTVAGVLIPPLRLKLIWVFTVDKKKKKNSMKHNLWERCFKSTIVLNVCHYTVSDNYIYTAVKTGKRKAKSLKWSEIQLPLFNKALCIIGISSGNPIYYCLNEWHLSWSSRTGTRQCLLSC